MHINYSSNHVMYTKFDIPTKTSSWRENLWYHKLIHTDHVIFVFNNSKYIKKKKEWEKRSTVSYNILDFCLLNYKMIDINEIIY